MKIAQIETNLKKLIRFFSKETFIVPLDVIEKAVHLMMTGEIVNYVYDKEVMNVVCKVKDNGRFT